MSEKFSLKWNDYLSNWTNSLSELRNDVESADVTLMSDDKVKFTAHKVLLSSCSNLFRSILKGNFHTNPILYLGGISSSDLGSILDYIYHGEVRLFHEQIDNFLTCAQKLEIKGLLSNNPDPGDQDKIRSDDNQLLQEQDDQFEPDSRCVSKIESAPVVKPRHYNREGSSHDVSKIDVRNMSAEEIDIKMKELYRKNDGVSSCLACDYSTKHFNIRQHVEIHLDGLSFSCSFCSKEFRSRNMLNTHRSKSHK